VSKNQIKLILLPNKNIVRGQKEVMESQYNQKLSLVELHKLVSQDLKFAKENADLADTVPCFEDQKEYWNAKVEAFQVILTGLEKTNEFVQGVNEKKNKLLSLLTTKIF
jgi:hypothetical protein